MRKHFLLFLLMSFLLPLGAWAEAVTLLTTTPQSREYNGTAPTITVKATAEGEALEGTWAASDGGVLTGGVPSENAGVYTWTENVQENPRTATFTIIKKQVVYFLTGSTYAIGDKPDVTNHYSLATGNAFIGDDKLEDYAEFQFATSGNDALDLDNNGRFTTIKTYNIKALRVVEKNVHQNYDFRFTSTAAIVVTAKSIANFVFDAVANQKYTGSRIEPAAPAIYASVEDQNANPKIALDASNYEVTYVSTSNANKNRNNIDVAKGGVIVYTGKGNYEGTLEVPFNIIPRPLKSVTVGTVDPQTYNYGTAIEPTLTVMGKGDDNKDYPLTLTTDYTVNYNNTNINAGNATGTLAIVDGGNFSLANNAQVANAKFVIEPKSLADNDIAIDAIAAQEYNGNAKTPEGAIKWTIGQTANNITANVDFTYEDNIAVGKATIIAKPQANADPQNYKDQKTSTFDIIPTALGEGVTIAFKKNVGTAQEPNWQNATYSYVAREIKPGTIEADGVLEVKDGNNVLKAGVDYEIVSYADETHDNKNAGNNKGIVTIKGIGNYGKISDLGDPITKSQAFDIAKAELIVTAKTPVTTTFGVAPVFSATNNAFESIGGKYTYTVQENNGTPQQPNWQNYVGDLTALVVGKEYRYTPAWVATDVEPEENPDEHETYSTAEEVAARANYDLTYSEGAYTHFVYVPGVLTVNNAKWIIVPDDQEKKYGVADAALNFTYKVYAGDEKDKQTWVLVNNAAFDENHAPIIGRPANIGTTPNNGENVLEGGYKIAVTNQTGDNKVQKAGYEIVCMTGTLNIVPFEITLTANDQTIYFGDKPNTETTDESFVKNGAEDGTKLTVTFAPVMLANGTLIKRTGEGSLDLKLVWDENGAIGEHAGALVPSITNPNFKVVEANITKGKVTVLQNNAITLWDGDENVLDLINSYDTKTVNVSIKITERDRELGGKARTWAAGQWNTMTLPFDITVKELSQILGYAVVNVVDEGGYTTNEKGAPVYKFNLTMKGGYGEEFLPANKPFVIKTTDALAQIVNNQSIIDFGSRKIVAPTVKDFGGVAAGGGSYFKPAYKVTPVSSANEGKIWFELGNSKNWAYIKSTSDATWNIVPFEGYIDQTGVENAEAAIFLMEDIDGTVTAINGVEVDDINSLQNANAEGWYTLQGVKLESAPTEKGIYIFNGKKVAVQ